MDYKKVNLESKDIVSENIEALAKIFPHCVTEQDGNKVLDFNKLKDELSYNISDDTKEKYELNWPGKRSAINEARIPTTKTLLPDKSKSVNFDDTENIYIEGDNLEVLKILQESYLNKIKCIYIDPPYNTGKDFIYKDNFMQSTSEELGKSGQLDEFGNRLVQNTESNGRYHSDWLTMMYSRIKLARNLLSEDGVIFISIDGNEFTNLKQICDEIFGEFNYIDSIVWNKKSSAKGVPPKNMMVNIHEYILAYQKSNSFRFIGEQRTAEKDGFKNLDNDPRGPWRESNIKSTTKPIEDAFTIVDPNTGKRYTNTWAFSKKSLEKMINENRIIWKESLPKQKEYMLEMTNENKAITSNWGLFDPQKTTMYLKKLMDDIKFDNPKPLNLMEYLLSVTVSRGDLVLDFFSGSGTTADALMRNNARGNCNCKYIMVQLPEKITEQSNDNSLSYKDICDIGEERIKRAGAKIKEETGADIDYGFRVFKLSDSILKSNEVLPKNTQQELLSKSDSKYIDGITKLDIVTSVMLDLGLMLDSSIEELDNDNYLIEDDLLLISLSDEYNASILNTIKEILPDQVVLDEKTFNGNDALMTNVIQEIKDINSDITINIL